MQHLRKYFSQMALSLACVVVAGCGGGDAEPPPSGDNGGGVVTAPVPDTTAPTMTIASDVSADVATGPVTFTFVFSEDVGISFEPTDLVVTGGTPSAFTRVSGTQATVVVTPTANTAGAITLAVAEGTFSDLAGNRSTAAVTASKNYDTVVAVTTEPTTAATTPPARAATDVLSVYSDAYAQIAGVDPFPGWGQSTVVSEVPVAGNNTRKYTNLNYEGTDWSGNPIDVSSMTNLHLDLWTADVTSVKVSIISAGQENAVTLTPTLSSWNSFDIDLAQYTVPNKTAIIQLKIEGTPTGGTLYLDNIYFWKAAAGGGGGGAGTCGTTEPTCAPATTVPAGAITIYSETVSAAGFNPFPNWGQATQYSEATIAGNKSLKYTVLNYEGIEFGAVDVTTKGKVHFDFWSPDLTSVKVSIISAGKENAFTQALTTGIWNSVDIDLTNYTVPDLGAIIQIKLEGTGSGTLYVDNIYFWGTPAGGGGGATGGTFTGGIFASDYTGSLAGTAQSTLGGSVGFFYDARLFATKIYDAGDVVGSTVDPGGVHNFYYGFGKAASPQYTDAYFGGFVNAPGNATADASAFAKVKLKFWGDAETWEKTNFTPQVEVVLQGPANAACTNPSGRPEITRTVAGQKIGAGSEYLIPKTDFTLKASCGGAATINSVWASVAVVVVQLSGTSLQYVNTAPSTPPSYPTFINIGPISFVN